jgi:hypothetical protein
MLSIGQVINCADLAPSVPFAYVERLPRPRGLLILVIRPPRPGIVSGENCMRIIAYRTSESALIPRPTNAKRQWMDTWPDKMPYRCLPLTVASGYGWEFLCTSSFRATWTGGDSADGLLIDPEPDNASGRVKSLGDGQLAFFTGCVIRTEAPYQLLVSGPLNSPKDGLHALSVILETSWAPTTIFVQYLFTRPTTVHFEKDEPFCQIFPLIPELIEQMEPEVQDITPDMELFRVRAERTLARTLVREGIRLRDGTKIGGAQGGKRQFHRYYRRATLSSGQQLAAPPRRYTARPFDSARAHPSSGVNFQAADSGSSNTIDQPVGESGLGVCPRHEGS